MKKVPACIVMADGSAIETMVGWRPIDMSAEAVADRERIRRVVAIAEAFAEVMRQWLSADEFAEMKRLNETDADYADGGACASHNYCDANMAMDEAMRHVLGDAYQIDDESLHPIWNEAWALARKLYLGTQLN